MTLVSDVAALRGLVSPYTGLVRDVGELLAAPDEPRLARVGARTGDLRVLVGREAEYHPGGASADPDAALAAALGEAAERYALLCVPEGELVLATAEELGPEAVEPESFGLFRRDQYEAPGFPFRPFTSRTRVRWARGVALPGGEPSWLPAQLVYLGHEPPPGDPEEPIAYSTTSGAACATDLETAILRGLLELVERDAFLVTWYARLTLPRIDVGPSRELRAFEEERLAPAGLRHAGVDLSRLLGVPTVLGVVRADPGEPAPLGVGAASAETVEGAWRAALAEAYCVRGWVRSMLVERRPRPVREDFGDVLTFEDHVHLYADPKLAARTRFLDSGEQAVVPADVRPLEDGAEGIAARLAARGVSAYAVDVTPPDLRSLGLSVARVLAPGLCQLDAAYPGRFLGAARLYRGAFEAGLLPRPLEPHELNPLPHPFP